MVKHNDYHVIIIGAGPAGGTAAYTLSRAGRKVLVIDKASLPRNKPCGGGLSLDYLAQVFPFSFESVIEKRINRVHYHYDGHKASIGCRPGVMAMVMRDRFDLLILQHAGCEVWQGDAVTRIAEGAESVTVTLASGRRVTADYLVGADGANSLVRRQSGLHRNQQHIAAIEAEVPYSQNLRDSYSDGPVFIFDQPRTGYAWIFPKNDGLSVGIGALGHNPDLKSQLVRIMSHYGISLADIKLHGHPIPVYDPDAILSTRRIILAGDAAGLADPFSGEGIRPAIKSGDLAARAIMLGRVDEYTSMVKAQLGRRNRRSLFLWKIFLPLREVCLFLGAPNPFTTEAILQLLSDRHSSLYVAGWSFITMWYYFPAIWISRLVGWIGGDQARSRFLRTLLPGME